MSSHPRYRLPVPALLLVLACGCGPAVTVAVVAAAVVVVEDDTDSSKKKGGGGAAPCATPLGLADVGFGAGGWITQTDTAGFGGNEIGRFLAIDAQGRIVVSGEGTGASGNQDLLIWRFQTDGLLDTTFNGQGWVSHDGVAGPASRELAEAGLAIDAQQRIVAAGSSDGPNDLEVVVWRFLEDGSLDTNFAGQGWLVRDSIAGGNDDDRAFGMALDESQRILVTGRSRGASPRNHEMFLLRFLDDGTSDPSFGYGGVFVHRGVGMVNVSVDAGFGIAFDSTGRIFVTGQTMEDPMTLDPEMCIWAFGPFGLPDASFGEGGRVVHRDLGGGRGQDLGEDIAVDANGRIVATGWITNPSANQEAAAWRYLPDGTPDDTFAGKGFTVLGNGAGGGGFDVARTLVLDCDGGLIICGASRNVRGDLDMVIWRLDPTGFLDPFFGNLGVVVHDDAGGGAGDDRGREAVRDTLGRIVATGYSDDPSGTDVMAVWRYQ